MTSTRKTFFKSAVRFLPGWLAAVCLFAIVNCSHRERVVTVGITTWVSNSEYDRNIAGFKDELAARGFKEGDNIRFLARSCDADNTRQKEYVREFKVKKVDLIYSLTTPGTLIVKQMTDKIPIVFSIVTYPVEAGVVKSLTASNCNAVGTRNYVSPAHQYYVFERIFPAAKTIAFVHRKGELNSTIQYREFKDMLEPRGIKVIEVAATDLKDLREQLEKLHGTIDAIYSACDTLIQSGGEEIVIDFSKRYLKPTFTCNKGGVLKGALAGNVSDFYSIGRISGEKAALILKGADPEWLQTESMREEYIAVNLATARLLHIDIPEDILLQAREKVKE